MRRDVINVFRYRQAGFDLKQTCVFFALTAAQATKR